MKLLDYLKEKYGTDGWESSSSKTFLQAQWVPRTTYRKELPDGSTVTASLIDGNPFEIVIKI